ncbi:MAG: hypothetical protein MZV70_46925 [Desulfobacterales bacterium]|nr:hypothetical protein [Desulfobacterales bacterium]
MKGGYEASSDTAAGKVVIRAVKQGSLWEITLRHRSPLATEVSIGRDHHGQGRHTVEIPRRLPGGDRYSATADSRPGYADAGAEPEGHRWCASRPW